jgi:hypothetical protein
MNAMLRAACEEIKSVLQASDTFKLLTTSGADRLAARAQTRKALIKEMVDSAGTQQASGRLPDANETEALLRHAELEAKAQERLAEWLKRAGGAVHG